MINSVEYVMVGSVRPVPSLCASHFTAECVGYLPVYKASSNETVWSHIRMSCI